MLTHWPLGDVAIIIYKTFREWQHPQSADISEMQKNSVETKNWTNMAILNTYLLHETVHHPTKFQADTCNPWRVRVVASSLRPDPSLSWKISKVRGTHTKIGQAWAFYIAICFMVLYIIPHNLRPISKIPEELEWLCHHSGWTDGQTDSRTDGHGWQQYLSAPMATKGN